MEGFKEKGMGKIATATKVVYTPAKFDEETRKGLLAHMEKVWQSPTMVLSVTIKFLKILSSKGTDYHPHGVSHIVGQADEIARIRRESKDPEEFLRKVEKKITI